jgi:nucleotide-binding universal stress UspA family protein
LFKDIIVNLGAGKSGKIVGDYAISVASSLEAHITGIAIAFVPDIQRAGMAFLSVERIEALQRDNEAAAETIVEWFAAATASAGVLAEKRILRANMSNAADQFGRIARRFDLAIVGQVEPDGSPVQAMVSESTLFESGRPMIIVPYVQTTPLKLDRIMVCWDGSRPAARAIADAMPFRKRAKNIEVVSVTSERGKQDEIEGAEMGRHLARHGFKVEVTRIVRGELDVEDVLLSHAADSDADFMIMGGYGHSRLREFVLGGVTRSILRTMTVPTLMSH